MPLGKKKNRKNSLICAEGLEAAPLVAQSFLFELLSWDKKAEVEEGKSEARCLCTRARVCVYTCAKRMEHLLSWGFE